jgi:uncharacterized protein (TIGR02300 family)
VALGAIFKDMSDGKGLPMPKDEWGTKRICPTTGKRFYDLGKTPIVSPYTGEEVAMDNGKSTRVMVADKEDKASAKAAETEEEEDLVVLDDDDSDDDASDTSIDDSLLEDDDDDDEVSLEEIADVPAEDDS